MNTEPSESKTPVQRFVMPLIRCTCGCGKVWDVAFVPWTFAPENAFKCLRCEQWCCQVQLFRNDQDAPAINVLPTESTVQKIFTTGQCAKLLKVAPRVVARWFDSGRLRGYRIPGSQDRRIPLEHLLRFLTAEGLPIPEELQVSSGEPTIRGANIPRTGQHDAGAIARCSYCGRYSDDPRALQYDPRSESPHDLRCDCGKTHGWCGSFQHPTAESIWSA